jgi:aspartyl protease family protein
VNVIGLFGGKAMVSIDGGKQRMLSAGQTTPEGVRLISADSSSATFEIDGKRQTLSLGQRIFSEFRSSGKPTVSLAADARGHFFTMGSINGASTRFMVDTGASVISMSSAEAKRLGISYLNGERGYSSTANGVVPVYGVVLNNVKLGDIVLNQVEGMVHEGNGLTITLLGMSFLKRLEMKREGTTMTLVKQY